MSKPKVLLHEASLPNEVIKDFFLQSAATPKMDRKAASRQHQLVTVANLLGQRLVLKTYLNADRGLERFRPLRLTRAWRSYHAAKRLLSAGIATPLPRFLVFHEGSLTLACDQIEGQQLYELIRNKAWIEKNRSRLVDEVASLLAKLRQAMITHGDLHPRNILIDRRGKAWLVDLDGARCHTSVASFARKRRKEENRLARELEIQPEILTQLGFRREDSHWIMQI